MSDIEAESGDEGLMEEIESSSDEEVIEIEEAPTDDVNLDVNNKYMDILLKNMHYPSKFLVHRLTMERVKALSCGAKPLCSNPPAPGQGDYQSVFLTLVKIAVKEVMENQSPMVWYNPITKTHWSANDLDKTLYRKIIDEAIDLAAD